MKELCQKSTLAYNYTQTVSKYASKGYQCIALAYSTVEKGKENLKREELEKDLIFLGFFLKKIELEEKVPECVDILKTQGVNLILTSSQCVYSSLGIATRSQIIDSEIPVLIGRTVI